jgi:dihydrofolate reductase
VRKVIGATFLTVDGVMQGPGGPEEDTSGGFSNGGWTVPYFDQTVGEAMDAVMREPFDLLLGKRTYEIFAAHWPRLEGDELADVFNRITKYVATTSDEPLDWQNSVALRGDVAAQIAQLKEQDGPNLLVQGSSVLYQTLFTNDLVDELTLLVFPVVLGEGKRLFGSGTVPRSLQLVDTKTAETGVVISTYARGGEVQTGSFALEDPA